MKKMFTSALKILFTAAILYYLVENGKLNFKNVLTFLSTPLYSITIFSIYIIGVFLGIVRWHVLVNAQGIKQKFSDTSFLNLIGQFFNTTLPGAVSGDVMKFFYMSKLYPGITKSKGFISMLVDRIIGLSGLFVLAFIGMFFIDSENSLIIHLSNFVIVGMVFIIVFYGFVLSPWTVLKSNLRNWLMKLPFHTTILKVYDSLLVYQSKPKALMFSLAISIVAHITIVFSYWYVASKMNIDAPFWKLLLIVPMGLITTAIPIAPAGIGLGHAVFDQLFEAYGMKHGADLFNVLVSFQIIIYLFGGFAFLFYTPQIKKPLD